MYRFAICNHNLSVVVIVVVLWWSICSSAIVVVFLWWKRRHAFQMLFANLHHKLDFATMIQLPVVSLAKIHILRLGKAEKKREKNWIRRKKNWESRFCKQNTMLSNWASSISKLSLILNCWSANFAPVFCIYILFLQEIDASRWWFTMFLLVFWRLLLGLTQFWLTLLARRLPL